MNMKVVTGTFVKSEYAQLQSANTLVVTEMHLWQGQVIRGRDKYNTARQPIQGLRTVFILHAFPSFWIQN